MGVGVGVVVVSGRTVVMVAVGHGVLVAFVSEVQDRGA